MHPWSPPLLVRTSVKYAWEPNSADVNLLLGLARYPRVRPATDCRAKSSYQDSLTYAKRSNGRQAHGVSGAANHRPFIIVSKGASASCRPWFFALALSLLLCCWGRRHAGGAKLMEHCNSLSVDIVDKERLDHDPNLKHLSPKLGVGCCSPELMEVTALCVPR